MTLDPKFNKYVSSLKQIRTIQKYLFNNSEASLIPRIENHNVDRGASLIQTTIIRCLHRIHNGDVMFDASKKQAIGLHNVV
jgi:2-phosphoglycerate kinase